MYSFIEYCENNGLIVEMAAGYMSLSDPNELFSKFKNEVRNAIAGKPLESKIDDVSMLRAFAALPKWGNDRTTPIWGIPTEKLPTVGTPLSNREGGTVFFPISMGRGRQPKGFIPFVSINLPKTYAKEFAEYLHNIGMDEAAKKGIDLSIQDAKSKLGKGEWQLGYHMKRDRLCRDLLPTSKNIGRQLINIDDIIRSLEEQGKGRVAEKLEENRIKYTYDFFNKLAYRYGKYKGAGSKTAGDYEEHVRSDLKVHQKIFNDEGKRPDQFDIETDLQLMWNFFWAYLLCYSAQEPENPKYRNSDVAEPLGVDSEAYIKSEIANAADYVKRSPFFGSYTTRFIEKERRGGGIASDVSVRGRGQSLTTMGSGGEEMSNIGVDKQLARQHALEKMASVHGVPEEPEIEDVPEEMPKKVRIVKPNAEPDPYDYPPLYHQDPQYIKDYKTWLSKHEHYCNEMAGVFSPGAKCGAADYQIWGAPCMGKSFKNYVKKRDRK